MAFSTDESAWDAFLAEWPLERLRTMSLEDYTKAGSRNTFTYWIEAGLDQYGSIWGGSSFKFGIYSRSDTAARDGDGGLAYNDHYGWYRRFGTTPEVAFEAVRRQVVMVAEAARAARFEAIDDSELGPSYRWKIAFHYQDRSAPWPIPCVFQGKPLLHFCGYSPGDGAIPLSTLYVEAAQRRDASEPLMEFSRRVWREWVAATPLRISLTEGAIRNGYLPINLISAPFPESVQGGDTEDEAGEAVQFRTDTGLEFRSDVRAPNGNSGRLRRRLGSYFQQTGAKPGDVIEIRSDDDGGYVMTHLPRHSLSTRSRDDGIAADTHRPLPAMPRAPHSVVPINRILFGPPGTGKTYNTINEALRILDPDFLVEFSEERETLKQRFDELVHAGVVRVVTFHQSFSYEDFVEGIRASTDEATGGLRYEVEDGVFKQVCEAARSRTVAAEAASGIDIAGRRVWKISLGDASTEQHIFDECMEKGIALMGFGFGADLTGVTSRQEIVERVKAIEPGTTSTDYAITALDQFIRRMQEGDLVVVTHGNLKFRAIGEVTGPYRYMGRNEHEHYVQARPVRWLRQYDPPRPYADLMENRFSQMTIYELRSGSINMDRLASLLTTEPQGEARSQEPEARVLIIDEINRGNISRIFGELITLIEPSKRAGAPEALEVTLPYSKARFSVPANVHLIGTMNTADRSLAGLDVALRRRFEFVEMLPDADALGDVEVEGIPLDALLDTMNRRIEVLLGRDYMLGHAYFMALKDTPTLEALADVFRRQVLPLLQEYFFEDWQKIAWVLNDHRKPDGLRFVRQANLGVAELLGDGVELPGEGRPWRINHDAFLLPEAYRAVIKAPQASP